LGLRASALRTTMSILLGATPSSGSDFRRDHSPPMVAPKQASERSCLHYFPGGPWCHWHLTVLTPSRFEQLASVIAAVKRSPFQASSISSSASSAFALCRSGYDAVVSQLLE